MSSSAEFILDWIDGAAEPTIRPVREAKKVVPLHAVSPSATPRDVGDAYVRYGRYVAAIAARLVGYDDEVDDIVQEVFLRSIRALPALRDEGAIKGFLATITVRVARRTLWKKKVARVLGFGTPGMELAVAGGASPEDKALLERVYKALETVPVDARMAWSLRHLQGEKLEDVAELLGCSLATAKRRISQAEAIMNRELGHE